MRLRIVHQLSLLLAAAVLLAVAAVGGLVAWNLKTGFSDYLRSRDQQQLERFAQVVADRAGLDGLLTASGGVQVRMKDLMDEFLHREGLAPPPGWRPPPQGRGPLDPPPTERPFPPPPQRDGGGPQAGRGSPDGLAQRIQVVDAHRVRIGGPTFPDGRALLEEPVRAAGAVVAYVRMLPSTEAQGVDARFLSRQYSGLAFAVAITLALALLAAWFGARRLGLPLRQVQAATRRIAAGELGIVVPESGSVEMAELIADVNRMAASLKTLEGARRNWLAQISHELRTPLSVLLGELESVQDGAREASPALVANLRDEVLHLVRLVNDLHTLSMADLGALPCEFSDGDASGALSRTAQRFLPRAERVGLVLEVEAGPPVQAHWDFGRIDQLVTNLLENSLRYTVAPGRVRLEWACQGGVMELRVEDTPPGVPAAQLEQVFEPLFRADSARQRRAAGGSGGSGLGLAICRAIVQAHGGHIRAFTSPLGGMGVMARLPLNPAGRG
ncbi:MAG: HAMP domain-containing protein [Burkholderiales bacterium]|nr:HAMP domain-containing protein [Burkholderiales bacterium]